IDLRSRNEQPSTEVQGHLEQIASVTEAAFRQCSAKALDPFLQAVEPNARAGKVFLCRRRVASAVGHRDIQERSVHPAPHLLTCCPAMAIGIVEPFLDE